MSAPGGGLRSVESGRVQPLAVVKPPPQCIHKLAHFHVLRTFQPLVKGNKKPLATVGFSTYKGAWKHLSQKFRHTQTNAASNRRRSCSMPRTSAAGLGIIGLRGASARYLPLRRYGITSPRTLRRLHAPGRSCLFLTTCARIGNNARGCIQFGPCALPSSCARGQLG
jgi:hypothetical protein